LSNSNVGGEQYNYSIPSDNNFYPMMHHNQMGGGNNNFNWWCDWALFPCC